MNSWWSLYRHKKVILLFTIFILIFVCLRFSHTYVNNHQKKLRAGIKDHQSKALAILVPFRDRFDELLIFVPQLSNFLRSQNIKDFRIYILNQSVRYRFNRGALANVGFLLSRDYADYIAIHDVDLLPANSNLSYAYPKYGPYHLASPDYHPLYNYKKYFGGILLINKAHYEKVNGMSNRYWGWGLEDDEFYTRIKIAGFPIFRPSNLNSNKTNTFVHIHYSNRKRDSFKTNQQKEFSRKRDTETGLSNINFNIIDFHNLKIDNQSECDVFSIDLACDTKITPWCVKSFMTNKTQAKT